MAYCDGLVFAALVITKDGTQQVDKTSFSSFSSFCLSFMVAATAGERS